MMSKPVQFFCLFAIILFINPVPALSESNISDFIKDGRFTGQLRYRYEMVDQDGPAPVSAKAHARTLRANLGFETGIHQGFQAFLEGQLVQPAGAEHFNDTINGKTRFPVIADPESREINQAWVSWNAIPGVDVRLGRQAINIENQRFIGTVDWRQNDQSFDALKLNYTGIDKIVIDYGYIANVNRVFGKNHPLGDLDSNSHFFNLSYQATDWIKVTGYGYWLEFNRLAARSSKTYGARAAGKMPVHPGWSISYEAEIASQSDYGDNAAHYDERYYHIAPALSGYGWTFGTGYEVLGGDGKNAFQTPLATLHKFNGWADKFMDTPSGGLEDMYTSISYTLSDFTPAMDGINFTAIYHDFSGGTGKQLGTEIDLSIGKSFDLPSHLPFDKLNVLAKYADYNAGDAPFTDTRKAWFQIGVTF